MNIFADSPLLLFGHYGILVSGQCGHSCARHSLALGQLASLWVASARRGRLRRHKRKKRSRLHDGSVTALCLPFRLAILALARALAPFAAQKLLASLVGRPDRLRRQAHFISRLHCTRHLTPHRSPLERRTGRPCMLPRSLRWHRGPSSLNIHLGRWMQALRSWPRLRR